MLRNLRSKRAQVLSGEYLMVLVLAISVITAMTIYFRRTLQARLYDANKYMFATVADRLDNYYNQEFISNIYTSYEPYYANTAAVVTRNIIDTSELTFGGSTGIFRKIYNQTTSVQQFSETAPPLNAD